ncbi:hypothetical protein HDF23_000136 [Mucilaginibacter lappiensis]|uniref:DUF3108 domain-containing protein n=1 Tax=Mucilaginibacter lappiensis TaxID=354630 RepID=A0ABR6PCH5_9SPHI|nr:hypothetical protein [Mucilaginibacter lappiensis]MBB6107406.1 hypothetical protein [Mucilaginibacter lappiensis]
MLKSSMRGIITIITLLFLGSQLADAQNCGQFVGAISGKKLTYVNLDTKGNSLEKITYTATKKNATTVIVHADFVDKDGKPGPSGDTEMICDGDAIKVDMKSFVPASSMKQYNNMRITGDVKYMAYPLNLSVGQKLDDGSVTLDIGNGGQSMTAMQMDIINRMVEKEENVTTNAGTFDCYKITYDSTVKIKMMGIGIPLHIKVAEWFSPKMGRFVKSETYDKKSKLKGTMVLDAIN